MARELRELADLIERSIGARPLLVMLAGSNGAGKSTFYRVYLSSIPLPFINADRIAAELSAGTRTVPSTLQQSPLDEAAQRMADEERRACIVLNRSFVTETVLSDPVGAEVAMLRDARSRGFEVWLFFVGIGSPGLSQARVRERVSSRGEHDVPADKIRARFARTLANLPGAIDAASVAALLDNDLVQAPFRFVALFENGGLVRSSELVPAWARSLLKQR